MHASASTARPQAFPFGFCSNEWTGNISTGAFTNTGDACTVDLHGGLSLQPEEAETTTIGFILTPQDWNVRFAADYYQIEISEAITPADSGAVLRGCFLRDPLYCSQIDGVLLNPADPLGGFSDIVEVNPEAFNLRGYKARGVDLPADWAGEYDFGLLSSRVIASRSATSSRRCRPALRPAC